jgi:DNA primase
VPLSRQMVDVARDGCDMGTPEGRARFVTQARPLWAALPEGALKRQMLNELNKAAALPEGELAATWLAAPPAAAERAPSSLTGGRAPRRPSAFSASRRAPRKPEDRIVHLLLMQPAWWDQLTAEDHELLHRLAPPHGDLMAWLERDIVEHGPRPWASVRTALAADEGAARALAELHLDDSQEYEAAAGDLRLLLDGRLLEAVEARQRELAAAAANDPAAMAEYRDTLVRSRQLRQRVSASRAAAADG